MNDTISVDMASDQFLDVSLSTDNNIEFGFSEYITGGSGGDVYTDNVLFKKNVVCAGDYTQVGNIEKGESEIKTLATKGKTLTDFINMVFTKELQPTITQPSVSISFPQAGSYEVGKKVTPTYNASLSSGSYTYGPDTGVVAQSWSVSDSLGNTKTSASGTFSEILVADNTNYTITASATHSGGVVALTNLGNASNPTQQIVAGTKTSTTSSIKGYRGFFYGVLSTSSEEKPLNSDVIRGLTNGGAYDGGKSLTISASSVTNPKRIVVAVPSNSTRSGLVKVLLRSAFDVDITSQYTLSYVNVEGYNKYTSTQYKVWVYEPAIIDSGEIHSITLG